jgi:hypothetical protein
MMWIGCAASASAILNAGELGALTAVIQPIGYGEMRVPLVHAFSLVGAAPMLTLASEMLEALPRFGWSDRDTRRDGPDGRVGKFDDRKPAGLAQIASERHSAS